MKENLVQQIDNLTENNDCKQQDLFRTLQELKNKKKTLISQLKDKHNELTTTKNELSNLVQHKVEGLKREFTSKNKIYKDLGDQFIALSKGLYHIRVIYG